MRKITSLVAVLTICAAAAGCARHAEPFAEAQVAASALVKPPEPNWRKHFSSLSKGAILVNLDRKFISYWEPDRAGYHVFPIAVPLNRKLRRTGNTSVVRRRENPDWRPTPAMRERMPDLPEYIGPGPDNPLGTRALYLGWRYYAIHGTNDPRSIGAQATSGCIRLLEDDIQFLYDRVAVGTPVRVLDDFEIGEKKAEPRADEGSPVVRPR